MRYVVTTVCHPALQQLQVERRSADSKGPCQAALLQSLQQSLQQYGTIWFSQTPVIIISCSGAAKMMSTLPLLVLLLCAAAAAASADDKGYDLVSEPLCWSEPKDPAAVGISSTVQQTPTPAKFQFIVAEHNKMRAEHGVGPLMWDDTLAQSAAIITNQCNFSHDPTLPVGENLAAAIRSSITEEEALERAITSWNGEEALYDYSKPGFDGATGHFTQVVWKDSTNIGCATTFCNGNFWVEPAFGITSKVAWMTVCHYLPPGNAGGPDFFRANVLPKVAGPPTAPPPSPSPPPIIIPPPVPSPSPKPPTPIPSPSPRPVTPPPTPSPAPSGTKFIGSTLAMGASITSGTCMLSQQEKYRLCINNFGEISVMLNRTSLVARWRTAVQLGQRPVPGNAGNNRPPYTLKLNDDYTITVRNNDGKLMMLIAVPGGPGPVSLQLRDKDGKAVITDANGACLVAWGYGGGVPAGC
ncbi:hypothetical protein OEZ86_013292 [Tetradesmus obliquus]|nr:hypothetical protein OEZ86_013292 [Tetradesmus obliquus]